MDVLVVVVALVVGFVAVVGVLYGVRGGTYMKKTHAASVGNGMPKVAVVIVRRRGSGAIVMVFQQSQRLSRYQVVYAYSNQFLEIVKRKEQRGKNRSNRRARHCRSGDAVNCTQACELWCCDD